MALSLRLFSSRLEFRQNAFIQRPRSKLYIYLLSVCLFNFFISYISTHIGRIEMKLQSLFSAITEFEYGYIKMMGLTFIQNFYFKHFFHK